MTAQFQVINKILQNKDFSLVTLNNLTEEHFYGYRNEFIFIKSHYDRFRCIPDRLTFADTFPDFDIVDVNEPDTYLIEQLFKEYNAKFIANKFQTIRQLVEQEKIDEAVDFLTRASSDIRSGSAMTCTDIFSDTSRYDRYLDRRQNRDKYYLSTGFRELDNLIGGIDMENENMVIAARTGIGKTWTLLKIAVEAAKQGLIVGIYSGEMSVDKVGYRVDTLLGHIDNKAITRGTDDDYSVPIKYENYINNIKTLCPGTIKVLTPNDIQGPATVAALRTFVEKEKLQILLIDQYSLLEDTSGAKAMNEKVANISKDVKNLQVLSRIPIISVSQMNRTKNEDGEQDTTQIGLSDRIGQDATSIIMISRDLTYGDAEKRVVKDDKLILNIVKSRDGGSGKLAYRADFNLGTFTFLNPNMSDAESDELASRYGDSSDNSYDDEDRPF